MKRIFLLASFALGASLSASVTPDLFVASFADKANCIENVVVEYDSQKDLSTVVTNYPNSAVVLETDLPYVFYDAVHGNAKITVNLKAGYEHAQMHYRVSGGDGQGGVLTSGSMVPFGDSWQFVITNITAAAKHFSLYFNANGGNVSPGSKDVVYDALYGELPVPTRDGHIFEGWFKDETEFHAGDTVKILEHTTLVARWAPITYSVAFAGGDGGSGSMPSVTYTYGVVTNLPASAFTRENYDFAGWTNSVSGLVYANQASVSNLTNEQGAVVNLTALWHGKTYTVRYHQNDGAEKPVHIDDEIVWAPNQGYQIRAGFGRSGYSFAGWAKLPNAIIGDYAENTPVVISSLEFDEQGICNLYAVWTAHTYTVIFNACGGEGSMPNMSREFNDGQSISACTFTRKGYVFLGWDLSSMAKTVRVEDCASGDLSTVDHDNLNLYAVWEPIPYSLVFLPADAKATGAMAPIEACYGEQVTLPVCGFEKDGYDFVGWTNLVGEAWNDRAVVSNLTDKANADVEFYAKWKAQSYQLTFDANGGGFVADSTATVTVDQPYGTLPAVTNATPRLAFAAWRYFDGSEWKSVAASDLVPPPSAGITNLVAYWVKDDPISRATDADDLDFEWGADRNAGSWVAVEDPSAQDGDAASAQMLNPRIDNEWVRMGTQVTGPGTLSFKWRICSDPETILTARSDADYLWKNGAERLYVTVNGNICVGVMGTASSFFSFYDYDGGGTSSYPQHVDIDRHANPGWTNATVRVESEFGVTNTLEWVFHYQDVGVDPGVAMVDAIVWTPDAEPQPWVKGYTGVYDGEGHGLSLQVPDEIVFESVEYSCSAEGPWSDTLLFTNVCDQTVYARFAIADREPEVFSAQVAITNRCVTLRSADASKTYDGLPLTSHIATSDGEGDFLAGETVTTNFTGTITNAGEVPNTFEIVWDGTAKASNYALTLVTGRLEVVKATYDMSGVAWNYAGPFAYDGTEKSVALVGMPAGVTAIYTDNVKTNAGSYVAKASLEYDTANYNELAAIPDCSWVIEGVQPFVPGGDDDPDPQSGNADPSSPGDVADPAKAFSAFDFVGVYDGEAHAIKTDELLAAYRAVMGDGVTLEFAGNAADGGTPILPWNANPAVITDVGATCVWYKVSAPNCNPIVRAAKMVVTNRCVTLRSADASKAYDGLPLTSHVATSDGELDFVAGETVTTNFTGTITDCGQVDNAFEVVWNGTAKESNYALTLVPGKLTVSRRGDVVVKINGHCQTLAYDGEKHTLEGYEVEIADGVYTVDDFVFSGNASVSGQEIGEYALGLKAADFENRNPNFENVVFAVSDGVLSIVSQMAETGVVGEQCGFDLERDLGVVVDADYLAGDKVAVKLETLPKGLKLVTTQVKGLVAGKTVMTNQVFTVEGVPTETLDLETAPMFARVTVTKKEGTKQVKYETLQRVPLQIVPAVPQELEGVLSADLEVVDASTLWPEIDAKWTFAGWPTGVKYTAKDVAATRTAPAYPAFSIYGKPTKAGVFTVTVTTSTKEKRYLTFAIWPGAEDQSFRHVDQAYVEIARNLGGDVTAATGLPTGLKFTAKDVVATKTAPARAAGDVYGTPTKPGVYAVQLTKSDKSKETLLWQITEGENPGLTAHEIGWEAGKVCLREGDATATIVQGAVQELELDLAALTLGTLANNAKVTVTGLPGGLKYDAKTGKITGVATKVETKVVTVKVVQNGVTRTSRFAIEVVANPFAGTYHAFFTGDEGAAHVATGVITPAAGGTAKLVLDEYVPSKFKSVKYTLNDPKGFAMREMFDPERPNEFKVSYAYALKQDDRNNPDFAAQPRTVTLDLDTVVLENGMVERRGQLSVRRDGAEAGDFVAEVRKVVTAAEWASMEEPGVQAPAAFTQSGVCGYFSAAFDAKKVQYQVKGKLVDGTAVSALSPLTWNGCTAPFLLLEKKGERRGFAGECRIGDGASDQGGVALWAAGGMLHVADHLRRWGAADAPDLIPAYAAEVLWKADDMSAVIPVAVEGGASFELRLEGDNFAKAKICVFVEGAPVGAKPLASIAAPKLVANSGYMWKLSFKWDVKVDGDGNTYTFELLPFKGGFAGRCEVKPPTGDVAVTWASAGL